jgi:WD40 repeat protein
MTVKSGTVGASGLVACLFCGSSDGALMCLDFANRVLASCQIDTGIRAVRSLYNATGLTSTVFTGCQDGSIRVHGVAGGAFAELHRVNSVHTSGVSSLSLNTRGDILASGGEDGYVRVWTVRMS